MESITKELTQSIKGLFDLTARIDERMKMIGEKQHNLEEQVDELSEKLNHAISTINVLDATGTKSSVMDKENQRILMLSVDTKISAFATEMKDIEKRLGMIERSTTNSDNHKKMFLDFIYKTIWVIFVCYILYKLNLQTPPLP